MLLKKLGERLRKRRREKNLTQSALAATAHVSPRFLVQLEKGQGNISVARLADVCRALELPLDELFAGLGPGTPLKLALVGLRGAGKSTVGAALSDRLTIPFIEFDRRIEQRAGMRLAELFELHGDARYRQLEREVLDEVLEEPGDCVIATGGSIVVHADNWGRLRSATTTVWLRATPESHLQRVLDQGDLRPMRDRPDALEQIENILGVRSALYSEAHVVLDTDALGLEGVVDELAAL